ncbi:TonB-dependent receptor [Pseudorhodoferax sp.]|uniref:TonB-dependent receptor n=1 Tax=Pseudorhodoferax sp. TaxID=1993553 RepID=UPI002DD6827E|nr:TonB-dependent receptor [Pseudorhodoferax sp.]
MTRQQLARTGRSCSTSSPAPLRHALALAVLALSATPAVQAQTQTQAPAQAPAGTDTSAEEGSERVIVTGTRVPKAVDKIPGAVTLIGREEIQNTLNMTQDVSAVLARMVPGYSESSQAMSNTGETLRGRLALRLFDGVPQGSPLREGTRNATFTDMGIVGRIEVINGPSASEGIGAAGGIINYISRNPTKMGSETTVSAGYTTQFKDDSAGWKLGLNYAYKADAWDFIGAISRIDRGMTYDGNGRRIGLNTSGSVADSVADNVFAKAGFNFGADQAQRVQVSYSKFRIEGNGNYRLVDGDRATGRTNTSERPGLFGTLSEMNDFEQGTLAYRHNDLGGGALSVDLYSASQFMRYPAEDGADRQDPLIAPLGTLVDQSEIRSRKKGLRTAYAYGDAFGLTGLELRGGVDIVEDVASQWLALTNRLWVPPMKYRSTAPWLQASYDIGPVTLSAGVRREDGELKVADYTTTYFRNRVAVQGGTLSYEANLPNIGLVWKLPAGWSMFLSNSKGFTLPNVGIPLRNVNYPGQSVEGILDLQAVIVKANEIGINWSGKRGSFGATYYKTKSALGQSLSIDPITNDLLLNRVPVHIDGYEFTGEWRATQDLRLNAAYSHTRGKTWFTTGGPLTRRMGVNDINPDKLTGSVNWRFLPQGDVTLGFTTLRSRDLNAGTSAEEHTKGYTLFDLSANWDWGRGGKTALGIENLTDKFYILSWSQVAGFRNYWSGRGRVVSVTHTFTF